MAVRDGCLVCGKLGGGGGSQRVLEEESALYTDILNRDNNHIDFSVNALSSLHWLCNICDRLVSQYEEISTEQKSIRAQLEERLRCNLNYIDGGEKEDQELVENDNVVENGEITDVSNFAREGVKIFEIDVKSEDVVARIAEQIRQENIVQTVRQGKRRQVSKCSTKSPTKDLKNELAAEFRNSCEDLEGLVVGDDEPLYQEDPSPPFECENCKKQFNTMASLSSHSKSCSDNDEQSCKLCNKQFANKRNLRDHNRIFHESPEAILSKYSLSCPECDKVFYKKSNLTSHMLRHSSEKPFICGVENCGKRFKREKTLVKHFQLIHQGIKEELLCVHCGAQFRSASGLRAHVSVHTGQETVKREVSCPHCEKAFRCKADLESHMVVHSRAKPFSCAECGVAFAQKASLKDHENVHLRKFECRGCEKAFGRERYLKLHMRTCSQLNPEERGEQRGKCTKEEVEKAAEEFGGEAGVQHILISSVQPGGGGGGEGDMVQVVQMQHQQVLHHLPPGLQLMVEGEQVTLVQEEGYQLVTQTQANTDLL